MPGDITHWLLVGFAFLVFAVLVTLAVGAWLSVRAEEEWTAEDEWQEFVKTMDQVQSWS